MHYYKRNLGDYAKKAGRLSMLQHGAYTLLIDTCYDREQFPTEDEAIEWTWASTDAEVEAVKFVLKRFFVFECGVYVQNRIKEEIDSYHEKAQKNKEIAIEREELKRERARNVEEKERNVHESSPNQEPITNNHKPIVKDISALKKNSAKPKLTEKELLSACGVDGDLADGYIALRKAKRSPITKAVCSIITNESAKAGISFKSAIEICVSRSWASFKADWDWKPKANATGKPSFANRDHGEYRARQPDFENMRVIQGAVNES